MLKKTRTPFADGRIGPAQSISNRGVGLPVADQSTILARATNACGRVREVASLFSWVRSSGVSWQGRFWPSGSHEAAYRKADILSSYLWDTTLVRHIYGVDIDTQAVEVTKLSLLLKVLEGESQFKLFHERALPDLGNNIKCGNSLIGPEFYDNQQMFLLDEDDRYRINVFDWKQGFPVVMKDGGFDAVIGNPPYGYMISHPEQEYFSATYKHQDYQKDLYLLFLEKCIGAIVAKDGLFGMIIPNPWLTNLLQRNIRKFILSQTEIREIVHFTFKVFSKATVDTEIVILQRRSPAGNSESVVRVVDSIESLRTLPPGLKFIRHKQAKWQQLDGGVINIFLSPTEEALVAKCSQNTEHLDVLCDINVGIKPYQVGKGKPPQNRHTVETRPFDADHKVTNQYRRYLRGADISRYTIAPIESRFLRYGPWLAEPRPAANFDAQEKIVIRQTGDSLVAALDDRQFLCLNNMHVLVPKSENPDIRYLLALINSRLMNWYYHTLNPEVGEALAEVKRTNVAKLPILVPAENDKRYTKAIMLCSTMLDLSDDRGLRGGHGRIVAQRQIKATDRQIDDLVYELYGLTQEEIAIVESAAE